jgi:hypothetical protein
MKAIWKKWNYAFKNIKQIFGYPFDTYKWVLERSVMLRHSLAHFDQIRFVLGLILVNPK